MPPARTQPPAPLFLVFGEDDFSVKRRARQLFDQWCAEVGGMDHEILDAQVTSSGEALRVLGRLREALQTLPFFGSGKVVWLQNVTFLGDDRTSQGAELTETLTGLAAELKTFRWEGVRLLVSAGKVDRKRSFYKTIEKLGGVEMFAAISLESDDWTQRAEEMASREMRALGKTLSPEALASLVSHVGPNLHQLHNEVEKLALFVGDRPAIAPEDIEAVVTRNKLARAFALGDALGERNLPRALQCLDEELWAMQFDRNRSEIGLLYGLISKVRSMILLKELQREKWIRSEGRSDYAGFKSQLDRIPPGSLPEDRRYNPKALHPYVLFRSLPHARRYSAAELVRAMDLLLDCNRRLVSSQLEEKLVLQQTLVQIVSGEERRPRAAVGDGLRG